MFLKMGSETNRRVLGTEMQIKSLSTPASFERDAEMIGWSSWSERERESMRGSSRKGWWFHLHYEAYSKDHRHYRRVLHCDFGAKESWLLSCSSHNLFLLFLQPTEVVVVGNTIIKQTKSEATLVKERRKEHRRRQERHKSYSLSNFKTHFVSLLRLQYFLSLLPQCLSFSWRVSLSFRGVM